MIIIKLFIAIIFCFIFGIFTGAILIMLGNAFIKFINYIDNTFNNQTITLIVFLGLIIGGLYLMYVIYMFF